MRKVLAAAVLALAAASTGALAEDDGCTKAPKEQWLTTDKLKAKLGEQGYTVDKVEIEDGCAEAKVKDKDGKSFELYLDPATAAVSKKEED